MFIEPKIVAFFLKRFDCNDGVSSHCESLIVGLRKEGWKVVLITGSVTSDSVTIKRFNKIGSLVEEWLILDDLKVPLPSIFHLSRIFKFIRHHQPAILHIHGYSMLLIARLIGLLCGTKSVATFHPSTHGNDPKVLTKSMLRAGVQKYKLYLSVCSPDRFIVCSSEMFSLLNEKLHVNHSAIRKILLGIDTSYFRPPTSSERATAREKFGLKGNDFVCTLVGRLDWNKGHDILIDAARIMQNDASDSPLICLFAGSGDQESQIKEYAFSHPDSEKQFVFEGYIKELRIAYWAADVFVLPSRSEGFALVVAEAMCCGLLPIRTPSGGAQDQIQDGKNGYIIPFDDVYSLVSHLEDLRDKPILRQALSLNALETASAKFSLESMLQKTISVYDELCSSS
jgi:glycosyltransferase involved in cell wall biosynthesis